MDLKNTGREWVDPVGILARKLLYGGGGIGRVGPELRGGSHVSVTQIGLRAGGGDVVTARPQLAKSPREGHADPASEVGGERQAPPRLLGRLPPASLRLWLGSERAHGASREGCGARGGPGVPGAPGASGCWSACCC